MNKSEEIAERIIRIAYEKGGTLNCADIDRDLRKETDYNVNKILYEYGEFKDRDLSSGKVAKYYTINNKGYELARKGFFNGQEKAIKETRIISITSILIAILSLIISAIALFKN